MSKIYIEIDNQWVEGTPTQGQKYKKVFTRGATLISYWNETIPEKQVTLESFTDSFTDDEYELYLDVDAYDKKAAKEEKQKSVKLKRSRDKLARNPLPVSEFTIMAQVFVTEAVLTQERFDEIITSLS